MQATDSWDKLYLHRHKIIYAIGFLLLFAGFSASAQKKKWVEENLPGYDKQKYHYGFSLAVHSSFNKITYNNEFDSVANLSAILPQSSPGFSIGFLVNARMSEFWDIRFHPTIAFYETRLNYHYSSFQGSAGNVREELIEGTRIEFPLLLKWKSSRHGNHRMYLIGGVKPVLEGGKRKDENSTQDRVELIRSDLAADIGFGSEIYFSFFKFSPELRFSYGLSNLLASRDNDLTRGLDRVTYNSITLYLNFQ